MPIPDQNNNTVAARIGAFSEAIAIAVFCGEMDTADLLREQIRIERGKYRDA